MKVSLVYPFFLLASREKRVQYLPCRIRKICLGKLYFFFHFFVALIFEGVIVKESSRWFILDAEGLCSQDSLE